MKKGPENHPKHRPNDCHATIELPPCSWWLVRKALPQCGHTKGFSLLWIIVCFLRLCSLYVSKSHDSHVHLWCSEDLPATGPTLLMDEVCNLLNKGIFV